MTRFPPLLIVADSDFSASHGSPEPTMFACIVPSTGSGSTPSPHPGRAPTARTSTAETKRRRMEDPVRCTAPALSANLAQGTKAANLEIQELMLFRFVLQCAHKMIVERFTGPKW